MPYTLTLTKDERRALAWVGGRYAHGDELLSVLAEARPDDVDDDSTDPITYSLTEPQAWRVREIGEESEWRWDCLASALASKLDALCESVV